MTTFPKENNPSLSKGTSLSDFLTIVSNSITPTFADKKYWVRGEVTGLKYNTSKGFAYFQLVEKKRNSNDIIASIGVTCWTTLQIKEFERATGQIFKNDIQILIECEVVYHRLYNLSLNLLNIDFSFTVGALALERQASISRLVNDVSGIEYLDGELLTPNKRLPLPKVIKRIAVISANNSDGYRDFLNEVTRNRFGYRFNIVPFFVPLQGQGADEKILNQLRLIRFNDSIFDVVAIVRGGGADTVVLSFNSYRVAKEISTFPIPVITGIGHDRNETISDLVAKAHCKTPTKAGEVIIHNNRDYHQKMNKMFQRGIAEIGNITSSTRKRVNPLFKEGIRSIQLAVQSQRHNKRLSFIEVSNSIKSIIHKSKQDRRNQAVSVLRSLEEIKSSARKDLKVVNLTIQVHDPVRILNEGYAYIERNDQVLDSVKKVSMGDELKIYLKDGAIETIVK